MIEKIDILPLKRMSVKFPPGMQSLIQSCPDQMSGEDFLKEFVRWRRVARSIDTAKKAIPND